MSDSCLTFGTGPLIGFVCGEDQTERGGEQADLPWKVSTLLMQSQIMNTTSHPSDLIVEDTERMKLTQRVTSSCVFLSTNHLYGTACVDMNANVMGTNTTQPNNHSSHLPSSNYAHSKPASQHPTAERSVSTDLAHFASKSVRSRRARAPVQAWAAGPFFNASTGATFIATSSSFVGCHAQVGGSIDLYRTLSSTLLNCVFIDSDSKSYGGCVYSMYWDALSTSSSITNCLVENCRTTNTDPNIPYSGGALYFVQAFSIQLNFINFRGNKAGVNPGNDIMFTGTIPLITSETIVGCSSTSDSPRMRVYEETEGTNNHLPNPTTTASLVSCVATAIDSDTAEFALKMSETITGTVLVLIDNTGGSRYPTSAQAPNIGRVLSFSFDNTDETDCVLDEREENAFLTLSGSGIPSGILSVTLSDNTVLDFEFQPKSNLVVPLTEDALPNLR
ncbi:hypothetical protein BLNAU_10703 [Blattamonas nauphoetae]|uniref:Uncharacterized protein n=1 Tax=Blattamonas nauphoetae TaxID=2049346 RepID=A0ABQ9XSZ4_9EUKA|nr:hypothetical protein BLNAU_10703 [Blattamonas nauphoetae]